MTIDQLAEAHLVAVQRDMETLKQRVKEANAELERLQDYFNSGVKVLNDFRSSSVKRDDKVSSDSVRTVFGD